MNASSRPPTVIVGRNTDDRSWRLAVTDAARPDVEIAIEDVSDERFLDRVRELERHAPRWTVRSLRAFSPPLLAAGVRIRRAHDLMLCHAILRDTELLDPGLAASPSWARGEAVESAPAAALFAVETDDSSAGSDRFDEVHAEWRRQTDALRRAPDARLALLCAAESTGALIAEEMTAAGVPWSRAMHEHILSAQLGGRPLPGARPPEMERLVSVIRTLLDDDTVNPDSPPRLLRALHRAGVFVGSTSRRELARSRHPVVEPLLQYKRLSRLFTANGWAWLGDWVHDDRFRPVYLVGGVVTGRWASSGGGALQIPRQLRRAVRADPGWTLVSADVAQLEPRMLAAMSKDSAMVDAARGADLYEGVVRSGAVASREEAKYAVLGAMYGSTTGESGRLVPRLRTVFPRAMAFVDAAARTGERGGVVSTVLGRTSPHPGDGWQSVQSRASAPDAAEADERRARSAAGDRGRFTRNFVVQGTAAEWALLWLAEIRHRLMSLPDAAVPATASGPVFASRAHLAFFLHDEVFVHCPEGQAGAVAEILHESAEAATARLFPGFPVDVPLDVRIGTDAGEDA